MTLDELEKLANSSTGAIFVITTSNEDLPVGFAPSHIIAGLISDLRKARKTLEKIKRGPLPIVHTVYPRCLCDECKSPKELAAKCLSELQIEGTPDPKSEESE